MHISSKIEFFNLGVLTAQCPHRCVANHASVAVAVSCTQARYAFSPEKANGKAKARIQQGSRSIGYGLHLTLIYLSLSLQQLVLRFFSLCVFIGDYCFVDEAYDETYY